MISLQRSMHSSQMYTPGPAMSFLTCFWLFPQKEHLSRSPPSPMRATGDVSPHPCRPVVGVLHCSVQGPRGPARTRRADPGPHARARAVRSPDRTPSGGRMGADTTQTGSPRSDLRRGLARLEDRVDQAVVDRTLGGQDLMALNVQTDLF